MENRCRILSKIKYCGLCGKKIWMQNYNTQNRIAHIMVRDGVCYECAYWEDLIAYPPEYMEVVNHKCLRLHPVADKKDKTLILGGKGKMRYFMRTDGSLIQSNDIWVIGTIPDRFSSQLPTSAVEITLKAYRQLKKSNKKCQARACLDRYHCFRYNRALENDERGPFNTVPPKWNVGDEHCGFFINLQDIKSDESSIISKPNSNETKTEELLKKAQQIMGDDSDFLIIAHKDGQCGAVAHGETDNIAQAIFSCMHQPNNPIGSTLYRIIKLIVFNTMNNPSPYASDLIDAIEKILPDDE